MKSMPFDFRSTREITPIPIPAIARATRVRPISGGPGADPGDAVTSAFRNG